VTGDLLPFPEAPRAAANLECLDFWDAQKLLARFNKERLDPGLGAPPDTRAELDHHQMIRLEQRFLEASRKQAVRFLDNVPSEPGSFVPWFERLKETGPGQGDPLFPWLAETASLEQMCWFLTQEVAGEAGFDDLVALTQVKMPVRAKLEMARNYWDEMGRGDARGMHGPMLDRLVEHLGLTTAIENVVPESLALGNMMMALAFNRHLAFQAVGALGVVEMTAPCRVAHIARGLDRLGIPKKESLYFALHATLDVKHSQAWNEEVLAPLVSEDPNRARAIAEGAILRLLCGARCFHRYRCHFAQAAEKSSVRGH
jgi:hypothetical protein